LVLSKLRLRANARGYAAARGGTLRPGCMTGLRPDCCRRGISLKISCRIL